MSRHQTDDQTALRGSQGEPQPACGELFEPLGPRSRKIRCTVCGATGYNVGHGRRSWMSAHLRGHAPCPRCGRMLSVLINGKPRTHGRCPSVPGDHKPT